jgi:ATP-dependent exoDNAse (exonuclease V) beta subunit
VALEAAQNQKTVNQIAGSRHFHQTHDLDYGEVAILCRASRAFQYYENALDAAGIPYLTVAGKLKTAVSLIYCSP